MKPGTHNNAILKQKKFPYYFECILKSDNLSRENEDDIHVFKVIIYFKFNLIYFNLLSESIFS